jgi:hypothetical protein
MLQTCWGSQHFVCSPVLPLPPPPLLLLLLL